MKVMNLFRGIGVMLSAALLSAAPLQAAANLFPDGSTPQGSSGYSEDGLWMYTDYGDGTVSVMCQDNTITEAVIPESIDGKTITMIDAECFMDYSALESVSIPRTVTHIEDFAFYNCTALKSVSLPNDLTDIAWQAFYGCASLTEVTIPASVVNIEEFVFEGCSSMEAINVSDANDNYMDMDGILFDYAQTTLIYYPSAKTDTAFTVPESCTKIEDWAFIGNPYLEEIDLSGVTEIGEDAFYHCTALKSIAVPEGVTALTGAVFGSCTSLETVTLPSTLESIGDSCFYSCTALNDITIPGRVSSIGAYAFFNCPSLESLSVYHAVKTIGDYALGYYLDSETQKPAIFSEFIVDTYDDTAAHEYCAANGVKSTAGVTQHSVFLIVVIIIVVLVIAATVAILIVQRNIQKRYELR